MTTTTPLSFDSGEAATIKELRKFAKPSAPISLLDLIAPVTTIGMDTFVVNSRKYAVSSKVSVP